MESPTVQPKEGQESEAADPGIFSPRLPSPPVVGRSRFCGFRDFADLMDNWLSTGLLGRLFHLAGSGHVSLIQRLYFWKGRENGNLVGNESRMRKLTLLIA